MPRPWTWFQKVQIGLPVLCISASLLLTGRGMMLGKRDERRAAARTLREERDAARTSSFGRSATPPGFVLGKRDERRAQDLILREERDAARRAEDSWSDESRLRAEDPGQDEARLHVDPLQFSHL
ncbi:hypothetical protein T484DRAFT_1798014, partial [Baffinella frigidus]